MPATKPTKASAASKGTTAKSSSNKKESKSKDARAKGSGRLVYMAGAAGVAFVALLVGSAHMLKRARRAARARGPISEEEKAAEAAAMWVVSERAMALGAASLLLLGTLVTLGVVYGQRVREQYAAMRAAARERAEARALKARKEAARTQGHAARLAAREAAHARRAEEREAQASFEAVLLAEIEQMRRANREEEALAAQRRLEESQAAYAESLRLDEELRSRQASAGGGGGGGGGGALYDEDDWDIGEWESAEPMEGQGAGEREEGGGAEEEAEEGEEEGEEAAVEHMPLEDPPVARGTRLALEGLTMPPAQTARPAELWLQLGCARCGQAAELALSGLRARHSEAKAWCDKCGCMLGAALRPTLLHDGTATGAAGSVLGFVDTTNCHVLDVPRLSLLAHCPRCFDDCPLPELIRGRRTQRGCFGCHAPVYVQITTVTVEALGGGGGKASKGKAGVEEEEDEMEQLLKKVRKKSAEQTKALGIVIGKPLPNKGTCAHYKHSYRWLRFPCCGRAYPCAICHEQSDCPAAQLGAWANRMLCGKCSRESPYSDKPCVHCGNTFTKPGGAHWQGGEGCRDQRRLDCKDSRKHKGVSVDGVKKSTSQKSHRVGALGKASTAAKKAAHAQ